jgi:hypothetical protein
MSKLTAATFAQTGTITREAIIAGVRAYALAHYTKPLAGWDILIECWSDEDISRAIGKKTRSILGAVQYLTWSKVLSAPAEARASVQAEGGFGDFAEAEEEVETLPSWEEAMEDLNALLPVTKKGRKKSA